MKQAAVSVIGMACDNCVKAVERALQHIGASAKVSIGSVLVEYDETTISLDDVKNAIEDLGYDIGDEASR